MLGLKPMVFGIPHLKKPPCGSVYIVFVMIRLQTEVNPIPKDSNIWTSWFQWRYQLNYSEGKSESNVCKNRSAANITACSWNVAQDKDKKDQSAEEVSPAKKMQVYAVIIWNHMNIYEYRHDICDRWPIQNITTTSPRFTNMSGCHWCKRPFRWSSWASNMPRSNTYGVRFPKIGIPSNHPFSWDFPL